MDDLVSQRAETIHYAQCRIVKNPFKPKRMGQFESGEWAISLHRDSPSREGAERR